MSTTLPPTDEMERAYLAKDASYDGLFFLGVRTTGIFCRPVCPARKPKPENVEYFSTAQAALFAGYRACKRCRPLQDENEPDWAAALKADVARQPALRITDAELRGRGVDPGTARRYFQRRYGMTFQAYARAHRLSGTLATIRAGGSVDDAVLDSGFESQSGFRDAFLRTFGDPPGSYRDGDCIQLAWIRSPLGPLVAGATGQGVCLLEFTDRRMLEAQFKTLRRLFRLPLLPGSNPHLAQLERELTEYFAGTLRKFKTPLVFPGTDFQRQVWTELLRIPHGETISYQELAARIGAPDAVRAVGRANGMNRIAIVIPCHRVINKNGDLCGYGGGLRRKEFLLNLEQKK
jgi:AraC family transcriptional regulator, regulatory protein of adaptative response / methylated-DNA-[protein]-cysteine methyltransferase